MNRIFALYSSSYWILLLLSILKTSHGIPTLSDSDLFTDYSDFEEDFSTSLDAQPHKNNPLSSLFHPNIHKKKDALTLQHSEDIPTTSRNPDLISTQIYPLPHHNELHGINPLEENDHHPQEQKVVSSFPSSSSFTNQPISNPYYKEGIKAIRKPSSKSLNNQNTLLKSRVFDSRKRNSLKDEDFMKIMNYPDETLPQLDEVHVNLLSYDFMKLKNAVNLKRLHLYDIPSTSENRLYDLNPIKDVYNQMRLLPNIEVLELEDQHGMSIAELALLMNDRHLIQKLRQDKLVDLGHLIIKKIATTEELSHVHDDIMVKICRHLALFPDDFMKIKEITLSYSQFKVCSLENAKQIKKITIVMDKYELKDDTPIKSELAFQAMYQIYQKFRLENQKKFPYLSDLLIEDKQKVSLLHLAILNRKWDAMNKLLQDPLIDINAKTIGGARPISTCLAEYVYAHGHPSESALHCVQSLNKKDALLYPVESVSFEYDQLNVLPELAAIFGDLPVLRFLEKYHYSLVDIKIARKALSRQLPSSIFAFSQYYNNEDLDKNVLNHYHSRKNQVALYLLKNHYDRENTLKNSDSIYQLLRDAIYGNYPEVVRKILSKSENYNFLLEKEHRIDGTPLILAIHENTETANAILDAKPSQRALSQNWSSGDLVETPLSFAIYLEKLDIAKRLISMMEDPNLVSVTIQILSRPKSSVKSVEFILGQIIPQMVVDEIEDVEALFEHFLKTNKNPGKTKVLNDFLMRIKLYNRSRNRGYDLFTN